jgi:hypothetical protein
MSVTPLSAPPVRRVRHQARESLAVMAFSAVSSAAVAGAILLITSLGR